jgi:hypothetical protein
VAGAGRRGLADGRVPADVMCCEAEAGAAAPKVSSCPTPGQNQPKPRCTAVVLVARQTGALTRGRRCKPVCGLSKGPLSCYCLWFECIVGQGGRVLRCGPIAPGGKPCPKSLMGSCAGGRAESGRPASGRRRRGDWSPCPGRASVGLGRCVRATTSTSAGATISGKKLMPWRREPGVCTLNCILN